MLTLDGALVIFGYISIHMDTFDPLERSGSMVFHRMLDEVFAARSHSAALRVLQDAARGFTGREIARQAGMTHRSALKALTRLEDSAW